MITDEELAEIRKLPAGTYDSYTVVVVKCPKCKKTQETDWGEMPGPFTCKGWFCKTVFRV